jgi:methionyl aminopeptidase
MIVLKSKRELRRMRAAGRITAEALAMLREQIKPGITTRELDQMAYRFIRKNRARPSFKGYRGFPASICASVNEEVVHGIPGGRVLKSGDIISVDLGVIYEGYQGDAAFTMGVGEIDRLARDLIAATEASLYAGIEQARPGNRLGDVSAAIEREASSRGFAVVREYVGHGIGRQMHEDPPIPNFGTPGEGPLLRQGMTMALEPMVNIGDWRTKVLKDNWTVVTLDGSLSAHFEHTVAITANGPEILTRL